MKVEIATPNRKLPAGHVLLSLTAENSEEGKFLMQLNDAHMFVASAVDDAKGEVTNAVVHVVSPYAT